MAILVDPRTGQKYQLPDENEAEARKQLGYVSPEEHAAAQQQEATAELGQHKLQTALGSAEQQAAKRISQVSALAGDVDAMGNPVNAVAPVAPETVAGIVPGLGGANAPELAAQQAANPISAGLGKAAADLPLYAAAGAVTAGAGSGLAGALGAGETVAGLAGAVTANAALSTGAEAEAAHEEHRPIDVENIGKNFAFGAILEGAGYGLAKGIGAALGRAEKPIQQAVQRTIDRAGVAAEDIGDPAVLASARAETQAKIESTATELANAAESVKPAVAGNVVAQRQAMRQAAEAIPDLADDLEAAVKRPRTERYETLLEMRDSADSPRAQEALDAIVSDRALWGDAAVDHGNALQAIAAARASGPEALAEAARAVKDPDVQRLVSELDSHFEDMQRFQGQELFGAQPHGSTAGAADVSFDATHYDKARSEILANDKTALEVASESDAILKDASQNTARNVDTINDALQGDLSVGEKYHDWEAEAAKWSPRKLAAQNRWLEDRAAQGADAVEAISAMKAAGYDGKSYAARIVDTIEQTKQRLAAAETPLARAQIAENAKRSYDRFTAGLAKLPEMALETPVKSRLRDILMPLAEDLRTGFEEPRLFGAKIANYQRASNAAYHKMIEPLMAVNQMLTERTPPVFGEVGQAARGNVAIQGKIETQLRSYLGGGTRTQDQLATAYEAVQELVAAKRAAGARGAQLSRLREVEKAIESLRDDQQLASVVRTAMKTAVEKGHGQFAGASPAATLGVGIGGHALDAVALHTVGLPIGRFVRSMEPAAARAITKSAKGLRSALGIAEKVPEFGEKGSAVRTVLEGHAQRYARSLSDLHGSNSYASETFGNQAPAYTALLRKRGANLGRVNDAAAGGGTLPPTGGSGPGAAGAPAANDIMTGTPGFRQAAQPSAASERARALVDRMRARADQQGYVVLGKRGSAGEASDVSALKAERAEVSRRIVAAKNAPDDVVQPLFDRADELDAKITAASPRGKVQARIAALPEVTLDTLPHAADLKALKDLSNRSMKALAPEERSALSRYVGSGYEDMRSAENGTGASTPEALERVALLKSAHDRTSILDPTKQGPLYRGLANLPPEAIDELLTHDEYITAATTSTSYNPDVAAGFSGLDKHGGAVIFKIDHADHGSVAALGGHESEVLLPAQQKFKITARQRLAEGPLLITVRQVGAASKSEMRDLGALGFAGTGPMAQVVGAGAAGLGGYKALQLAQEPPQGADDEHAQYLAQAGARDTTATARALTDPAAAKDFARRSRGQPSTLELFQGDHDTIQQAFLAQRGKVEQMMRDPSGVVDSLADAFGGLSPALRDQLAAKAMVIATYLHAQLPPQRGVSVMRPNGLPPAPLEARAYALKFMTATQPATAFDDAKRGQLRHEQVDTLKATWPEQYDDLRQQTLTELGHGKSTIVQRQRADLLFSFQTALDPAFSSRLSAAAASARQVKQENASGGAGGAPTKSRVTPGLQPAGIAALSA